MKWYDFFSRISCKEINNIPRGNIPEMIFIIANLGIFSFFFLSKNEI